MKKQEGVVQSESFEEFLLLEKLEKPENNE